MPSNVSQKPKQIKIKGKKSSGLYLLNIIFNENRGSSKAKVKLMTLKNFVNILITT
jgi:hypothetical protein